MTRRSLPTLVGYWAPALFMLACIGLESTDVMSAANTGGFLFSILKHFFPVLSPADLSAMNLIFRKTGHVIGYGLLCASFYRGIRGTVELNVSTGWASQNRLFIVSALAATLIVAVADEVHQMGLSSRTGSWWDVLLDFSAAAIAQLLIFFYVRHRASAVSLPN